jgi:hypothetical protein
MKPLDYLNALADKRKAEKHPGLPAHARVKSSYTDKSANELSTAIIACIDLHDGYAVRINTQGQYNEKLGRRTFSTTRRGTADIHACMLGRHLSIEVKYGRDTLSGEQRETGIDVEKAQGLYFVARTYDAFWLWFQMQFPATRVPLIPQLATPDPSKIPHRA